MAILAGGQGSRMGGVERPVEKGLLKRDGVTLVERLIGLPVARVETLVVTDRPHAYRDLPPEIRKVPDASSGAGPAGGLVGALAAARTPWVLVLGCDLAWLTAEALEPLLDPSAGDEALAYRVAGQLEPLPALIAGHLLGRFRDALAGQPGLGALIRSSHARFLDLKAGDSTAQALRSVNYPADLPIDRDAG